MGFDWIFNILISSLEADRSCIIDREAKGVHEKTVCNVWS